MTGSGSPAPTTIFISVAEMFVTQHLKLIAFWGPSFDIRHGWVTLHFMDQFVQNLAVLLLPHAYFGCCYLGSETH